MPDAAQAPFGVASRHATLDVPTAAPGERIGDVRARLEGQRFSCAEDVAVLEGGRLAGVVPIEWLLAADAGRTMTEVMDADPPAVAAGTDQERVAHKMIERGESSVAVIDEDGRFQGLIPPHTMLAVLLEEHHEDVARLSGFMAGSGRAKAAAEEPVRRRIIHRLPWLLVGLLGAMASAVIIGAFEEQIADNVLLALFVPAVVYLADAVGTQTEAVMIRGLSAGIRVRLVIRREVVSGLLLGLLIAALFLPFALAGWGDASLALAVALALLCSCAIATVVAVTLPLLFNRAGADPAFGSGPLATVIQDLLSIAVYFAVAVPLAA